MWRKTGVVLCMLPVPSASAVQLVERGSFPGPLRQDLTIVVAGVNCRLLHTTFTGSGIRDNRKNGLVAEGLCIEGLRGRIQNIPATLDQEWGYTTMQEHPVARW